MRYIILGGTGVIGSSLARALLRAGDQVVILSRNPQKARVPEGAELVHWDGRSAAGWTGQVNGADGIVNLAAVSIGTSRWSQDRKNLIVQSRENAGAAVVEAVHQAEHKPEVVVQISGVGYYGVTGDRLITEQDPPGSDFLARVAVRWEEASRPVETQGVRWVAARSGVVLDPHSGVLPRMMLPFNLLIGGPIGSGKQWVSWIHLADQVQGLIYLLKNQSVRGIYNLTSPQPATNADFGKTLGKVMRRPYWIPAPGFGLKLVLGEMSTLVLDGQRVIPRRLQEEGFQFLFPRLEDALANLLARV